MRKIALTFLTMVLLLTSCGGGKTWEKKSPRPSEIEYTSNFFEKETFSGDFLTYFTGVNKESNPDDEQDAIGLYGATKHELKMLNQLDNYWYDENNQQVYKINMDYIKKTVGNDVKFMGAFQDVVILFEEVLDEGVYPIVELVTIATDRVLYIKSSELPIIQITSDEVVAFTGHVETDVESGLDVTVMQANILNSERLLRTIPNIGVLYPKVTTISPMMQYLKTNKKEYIAFGEALHMINGNLIGEPVGGALKGAMQHAISNIVVEDSRLAFISMDEDKMYLEVYVLADGKLSTKTAIAPISELLKEPQDTMNRVFLSKIDDKTIRVVNIQEIYMAELQQFVQVFEYYDYAENGKLDSNSYQIGDEHDRI